MAFTEFVPTAVAYITVQYIGDEALAEDIPHGNAKDSNSATARPFQRTAPSVLTCIATEVKDCTPAVVHKAGVASAADVTDVHRDQKQVRNVRERVQASVRLSRDGLANLHDVAYDLPDFV